jgi:hypothetical protein
MTANLGTTDAGDLTLDLDRLIGGHMGIVANAGGGKLNGVAVDRAGVLVLADPLPGESA